MEACLADSLLSKEQIVEAFEQEKNECRNYGKQDGQRRCVPYV